MLRSDKDRGMFINDVVPIVKTSLDLRKFRGKFDWKLSHQWIDKLLNFKHVFIYIQSIGIKYILLNESSDDSRFNIDFDCCCQIHMVEEVDVDFDCDNADEAAAPQL